VQVGGCVCLCHEGVSTRHVYVFMCHARVCTTNDTQEHAFVSLSLCARAALYTAEITRKFPLYQTPPHTLHARTNPTPYAHLHMQLVNEIVDDMLPPHLISGQPRGCKTRQMYVGAR